ncbi:MAG: BrnT family toxin [Stellaceae bacterium]
MEFEWDAAKAARNLAKHGVDFPQPTRIFDDPNIRRGIDPRLHREVRYRAIGSVSGMVLFVCYTMRGKICRIISAGRASRRERRTYSL